MPKNCQLIFQTNTWLSWAKVLSADLSDKYMIADKYFICDRFFIVFWSFRYVMPKYCQLIFQTNTWLAWAKVFCQLIFQPKIWLPINTWFVTESLLSFDFSADLSYKNMVANKSLICDKYFIWYRFFIGDILSWRSWSIERFLTSN